MEQPTIALQNIINIETFFKREIDINFENYLKAENPVTFNTTISINPDNDDFVVYLIVEIKQFYENKNLVDIRVNTAGLFKKNNPIDADTLDNFCNINAPAIIFPFIRETISNLSVKAGLNPILLQPINFVELNKQKKINETK